MRVCGGERRDQTKGYSRELNFGPGMEIQSLPKYFTYPVALKITLEKRFDEADWRRKESSPTSALYLCTLK